MHPTIQRLAEKSIEPKKHIPNALWEFTEDQLNSFVNSILQEILDRMNSVPKSYAYTTYDVHLANQTISECKKVIQRLL